MSFCAAKNLKNKGPYPNKPHNIILVTSYSPRTFECDLRRYYLYLRTKVSVRRYEGTFVSIFVFTVKVKKCEQSKSEGCYQKTHSLLLKCAAVQRMETRNINDDEEAPKGSQSWLRDLWSQKNTTAQTPLARTMSGSRTTLPVFFDRTTSVGSTAFWLKEPHALAALNSEGAEQETKEAELARAAQAALEVAQVRRPRRETVPLRKNMSCLVVCA